MIEFPYGIADFRRIRQQGRVYVDRTAHIRDIERLGDVLVFLRPRRFGKSLWIQTLANYYDLGREDEFEKLFGDLAIANDRAGPTALRNRYFVLQWNFSNVNPGGNVGQIAESLNKHIRSRAEVFQRQYRATLPEQIKVDGDPAEILDSMLSVIRETPYKLYLLIDEYDNFINEVMVSNVDTYHGLIEAEGPYKLVFKSVKNATEGLGLERVFVTGVSPVALNDLTSGFNNAEDVSLEPALACLCGFRETEIGDLLQLVAQEQELSPAAVEQARDTMRTWYNGYRFAEDRDELIYNPTNALYFLKRLCRNGKPPRRLHDENLRTDRGKLAFLGRTAAGTGVIRQLTQGGGEIDVPRMEFSFSLDDLTARLAKDRGTVASFLYYMGLLTLTAVPRRLRIPNLVVRKLFLDRLLEIFLPDFGDSSGAREIAMDFFSNGDLRRLLSFFEERLLPVLSTRDHGAEPTTPGQSGSGVNEMVVKTLFLSVLFDDTRYVVHSELEIERGYIDLCLLVRPEMIGYGFSDFLFEFKLVRRKQSGKTGQELAGLDETQLRKLPAVAQAFTEARDQAERYGAALKKQRRELNLRSYIVVAVGLERMLGEEITTEP